MVITKVEQAVELLFETLERYPERNLTTALAAATRGESRVYPALALQYYDPQENTVVEPHACAVPELQVSDPLEHELCHSIIRRLTRLDMLNPIATDLLRCNA
jgi:hypothetical protein